MALRKPVSIVPKKRAARRMKPKSEAEKKAALDKIWADIEKRENEYRQKQEEKEWLNTKKKRVKQIETQKKYLDNFSDAIDEPPLHGTILLKYRTKGNKTTRQYREDLAKREPLKTDAGLITTEEKYNELLKRNKKILNIRTREYQTGNLSYILINQKRAISKTNLSAFGKYHEKVVDYIFKKYNKKRIDYNTALDMIKKVDFCVKKAIAQNKALKRISPHNVDLHSEVVGKILVNFLKKRDYPDTVLTLEALDVNVKKQRNIFKDLNELDQYYK
jgi:hypothetical protein